MNHQVDFVFVGPQRTGTSWIDQVLREHPQLCLPKNVKETMFFDKHWDKGLSYYQQYFSECVSGQRCVEVCPTYFDNPDAPKRIKETFPEATIIVTLRESLDRALSLYRHHVAKGRVKGSFSDAIETIPQIKLAGKYKEHLARWVASFGKDKIEVVLFDDIGKDPQGVFERFCMLMNINYQDLPVKGEGKIGGGTMPKYQWLAKTFAKAARFLRENKLDFIAEFGKKLGLRKVYSGGESKMPDFTNQERDSLLDFYKEDVNFVEQFIGRKIENWHK